MDGGGVGIGPGGGGWGGDAWRGWERGDDVLTTAAGCFLSNRGLGFEYFYLFFSASYEATVCRSFLHVDILLVL